MTSQMYLVPQKALVCSLSFCCHTHQHNYESSESMTLWYHVRVWRITLVVQQHSYFRALLRPFDKRVKLNGDNSLDAVPHTYLNVSVHFHLHIPSAAYENFSKGRKVCDFTPIGGWKNISMVVVPGVLIKDSVSIISPNSVNHCP